jgi:hypothetical protein
MTVYEVQVMQPYYSPTPHGRAQVGVDWDEAYHVPQLETEQAELREARRVADETRKFYAEVRIMKWTPGGSGEVVK